MKRRAFLCSLIGLGALVPLSGCSNSRSLKIGTHPWPGYEPLHLAEHFGWLPQHIALHKVHSASESLAALHAGSIDGATLTLDEVLSARVGGLPLSIVLVLNESVGADVVLARAGIGSAAELRGKRIAVEHSAVGRIVLHKVLLAGGLAMSDITLVDLPHDQQLAAWESGAVDAVVTYAPTDAHIERSGGQRIFDSRRFPGTIFDVLAFRRDRLRWRSASIEAAVVAHLRGLDHLRVNRDDAIRRIAGWRNLSAAETERAFGGLALPDLVQNQRMLSDNGAVHNAARQLNRLMVAHGHIPQPDSLDDLIDATYLPKADARS